MSAIEQLVKDNKGLAYHQLHRFNLAYDEDAVSYAMEALFKAAKTYDSDKNITFSTYASACIYNGIQAYLREINKRRVPSSSLEIFMNEHGDTYVPSSSFKVKSAEDEVMALTIEEIYGLAWKVVDTFKHSGAAYKCIKLWIESDFTLKTVEIAPLVGCSQPSASKALNAFRNKLKEELKNAKS